MQSQCAAEVCRLLDCRFQMKSGCVLASIRREVDLPREQSRQQQVTSGTRLLDEPVFAVDIGEGHCCVAYASFSASAACKGVMDMSFTLSATAIALARRL